MAVFVEDATFAKNIFEFIGTIIVILGIPAALYNYNWQRATRHVSDLAMDEDEMGYFRTRPPCRLWCLFPLHIPTVSVPRVPSVGTLIRAGDDGVWSSAMLLAGGRGIGRFISDPAVSWPPVYEAFFREYAWAQDGGGSQIGSDPQWKSIMDGKEMEKYRRKAESDVWRLKHKVSGNMWTRHLLSWWHWSSSWLRRCFDDWILNPVVWHLHLPPPRPAMPKERTVDVDDAFIQHVDRHLLYYPWRISNKDQNTVVNIAPILISCIRPLGPLNATRCQTGQHAKASNKRHCLRVFNGVPAVKISEEDLGALCTILGIETAGQDFLPCGRGALGHLLTSHTENGTNIVRLGYHDNTNFTTDRTGGSGYSPVYAKHLACGCIPFGRLTDSDGTVHIHTLAITSTVDSAIRQGRSITDDVPPPDRCIWRSEGFSFLEALPRVGNNNYYSEPLSTTTPAQTGRLYRCVTSNHGQSQIDSGSGWCDVVAGIAFGGLVPMTTGRLADLVKFSVGTELTGKDMESFRRLMKLVLEQSGLKESDVGALLFGRRATDTALSLDKPDSPPLDFTSEALGVDSDPIRSIGRKLAWLSTLLEALIALVDDTWPPTQQKPADLVLGDPRTSEMKRNKAFEACAEQINESYQLALDNQKPGAIKKPVPTIVELLDQKDLYQTLNLKQRISADQCGTVAKCIIIAWASLVRIVEWDDDGNGQSNNPQQVNNTVTPGWRRKTHKLLTLEELPDIALWE